MQIKKLVDNYRFEKEVQGLFMAWQEAQVLSAAHQTDFSVDIYRERKTFFYRFSTDEPLSKSLFSQKKQSLAHVKRVGFSAGEKGATHFTIYSGGRVEPRGVLTFYSMAAEEKGRALHIDLSRGHLLKFRHALIQE